MTLQRMTVHRWSLPSSLRCAATFTASAEHLCFQLTAAACGANELNPSTRSNNCLA